MLDIHGELLPLLIDDDISLYVFNVWTVDAFDEKRSTLWRVPTSEDIVDIEKPVFIGERIRGLDIFRLPYRAMPTYVSDRFVGRVELSGLVGLTFDEVGVA